MTTESFTPAQLANWSRSIGINCIANREAGSRLLRADEPQLRNAGHALIQAAVIQKQAAQWLAAQAALWTAHEDDNDWSRTPEDE